jgi:hypothetical protein
VEVIRFTDGHTRHEVWELPDSGWDDWAATADRFLARAIRGIASEYAGEQVEWLEVNHWPYSGRLIVFPSQDGPHGDRGERVCFELASEHLLTVFRQVKDAAPEADREWVWVELSRRVWVRTSECLLSGAAGRELTAARQLHRLRVAGYDYRPGDGLYWLTEDGAFRAEPAASADVGGPFGRGS